LAASEVPKEQKFVLQFMCNKCLQVAHKTVLSEETKPKSTSHFCNLW